MRSTADAAARARYLAALVDKASPRGIRVAMVKPPIPERVHRTLPDGAGFDLALHLQPNGLSADDFSHVENEPRPFYDTDHLNREAS